MITNLKFLNMVSNLGFLCQKLVSLFHAVSLVLIQFLSYFSRLQQFGFLSKKNERDMRFLEAEREGENDGDGDKSELQLKFKFPTFDEFSRIQKVRADSYNPKLFSSALIEVLTTFPPRESNGDKIDATEFAENKVTGARDSVDEFEFYSEISSDGFLSDGDLGERLGVDSDSFGVNKESPMFLGDGVGEIKKVELNQLMNSDFLSGNSIKANSDKQNGDGFLSVNDMGESEPKLSLVLDSGDGLSKAEGTLVGSSRTEKDCSLFDNDRATNKLESLWEHQELIEQLQMELRKVKATGLPTIAEESESPKTIDDLKPPWKIEDNDKLQHQDCMGELHKFYKSYREMMRKFDILNYQKMYAMGFLQLNDPLQPKSQQKLNSVPMLKSLVSQKLWLFKHKRQGTNPIKKLINELQGDVEVVYVGQMCLSWEFLHWQYQKALELWSSDPQGIHRYNDVAAEIQQFQVLVQRFTEDEPFQGPRAHSFAKTRCVLRNLLQVPLIREDCLEDSSRSMKKERDEYVITSEMLVEMIEESIRIFWEFIRLDKDCGIASNSVHNKLPELHSHEDLKLSMELRKILQKKERKLKDILRSENCILRKLQKRRRDDSDQALHFFAQVDLKLVSRVFNMSRITRDQLIWCENKLSKISFVSRKIYVEPAFLLFPC